MLRSPLGKFEDRASRTRLETELGPRGDRSAEALEEELAALAPLAPLMPVVTDPAAPEVLDPLDLLLALLDRSTGEPELLPPAPFPLLVLPA